MSCFSCSLWVELLQGMPLPLLLELVVKVQFKRFSVAHIYPVRIVLLALLMVISLCSADHLSNSKSQ
jgi:hypothetical protein